jgi:hypothetical protein
LSRAKLKVVDPCGSFAIDGEQLTHVEPGLYDLAYLYYETRFLHNRSPKLVVWFKIITMGSDFEKKVPRYYNVKRLIGKARKNGDFKVGQKSDFLREFFTVSTAPVTRLDRIPMGKLGEQIIQGNIDSVTTGYDQRPIPKQLQYSVVRQLVGVSK